MIDSFGLLRTNTQIFSDIDWFDRETRIEKKGAPAQQLDVLCTTVSHSDGFL